MNCYRCGQGMQPTDAYCPACGARAGTGRQTQPTPAPVEFRPTRLARLGTWVARHGRELGVGVMILVFVSVLVLGSI